MGFTFGLFFHHQNPKTMINTILLENKSSHLQLLQTKIEKFCPCLKLKGVANTVAKAKVLLAETNPELIFINPDIFSFDLFKKNGESYGFDAETIFVSNSTAHALDTIHNQATGYIFRPIQNDSLIFAVEKARERIKEKVENKKNKLLLVKLLNERNKSELVGIPTVEGFEFVYVNEIIRCEGLQKCTRVLTSAKTNIISSYNIGEFKKLLEPYGFFSPHKSHLINLSLIKKYKREGTIILRDDSYVPVAKRKKSEFLKQIIRL